MGKYICSLRDLLFPRRCVVCGEILSDDERHLCMECFEGLPLTCFWQWQDNPAFDRISSKVDIQSAASLFFFRSDSPYRNINYFVKYGHGRITGYRLGFLLGKYLVKSETFPEIDLVVPVPLHWFRKWNRGYNQSEMIAKGLADALGKEISTSLLKRVKYTATQTKLSDRDKIVNVRNAFSADKREKQEMLDKGVKHILIVDDLLTTGSTLSECASALVSDFKISAATLAFVI